LCQLNNDLGGWWGGGGPVGKLYAKVTHTAPLLTSAGQCPCGLPHSLSSLYLSVILITLFSCIKLKENKKLKAAHLEDMDDPADGVFKDRRLGGGCFPVQNLAILCHPVWDPLSISRPFQALFTGVQNMVSKSWPLVSSPRTNLQVYLDLAIYLHVLAPGI